MADTFDIDPSKLQVLRASFEDNSRAIKELKTYMTDLDKSLKGLDPSLLGQAKDQINEMLKAFIALGKNVNQVVYYQNQQRIAALKQLETAKNITKESQQQIRWESRKLEIHNAMLEIGYESESVSKAILKITEEDVKAAGAELVPTTALTKEAKKRLELEIARANATEKWVKLGNDMVKINEADLKANQKSAHFNKENAEAKAKQAGSSVGLDLSLGGILKKLIEAYDQSNRLNAMSRQAMSHWAIGSTAVTDMSDKIQDFSKKFQVAIDVAGEYHKKLAIAGMQFKDLNYFAEELYAREVATGMSIDSQVSAIKELRTEYKQTNSTATGFLEEVQNIQRTLPYLNMDEISTDIMQLGQNAKAFNVDLLGTIGMYKTLMRDSKALQAAGLGAMPRSFRKEMAESLSKMSAEMPLGYKAFFGRGIEGVKSPAQAILEFEKMGAGPGGSFKQLSLVVDRINKIMPSAPKEERTLMVRQMLGNMGIFSQNLIYQLSPLIESGKLSKESIDKLLKAEKAERPGWVKDVTEVGKAQQAKITEGVEISNDLLGLLKTIELYITNFIVDLLRGIQESLAKLTEMMPKWLKFEDERESMTAVEYYQKGGGTIKQNLWDTLTSDKTNPAFGMAIRDELVQARLGGKDGAQQASLALAEAEKLAKSPTWKAQFEQLGIDKTTSGILRYAMDAGRLSARTYTEMQQAWRRGDMEEFYSLILSELRDTGRLFKQTVKRKARPATSKEARVPDRTNPLERDR